MRTWLKDIRKKANMTQLAVAEMSGIDITSYGKIELGQRRPSPETAKAISSVLGFEWTAFFPELTENTVSEQRSAS